MVERSSAPLKHLKQGADNLSKWTPRCPETCIKWLRNKCTRGDQCPYLHKIVAGSIPVRGSGIA